MATTRPGQLLSNRIRGLRPHQGIPQKEGSCGGCLYHSRRHRGRYKRSLGIYNNPVESATGWGDMFDKLRSRGVQKVGLMVADGITGLDTVIGQSSQELHSKGVRHILSAICLPM